MKNTQLLGKLRCAQLYHCVHCHFDGTMEECRAHCKEKEHAYIKADDHKIPSRATENRWLSICGFEVED
jgi:hypothetical protein